MREHVSRGALLLDDEMPGWHKLIDRAKLDMQDCEHCILGQLYGDFGSGLNVLQVGTGIAFGFLCSAIGCNCSDLTELWLLEINKRLNESE